MLTRQRQDGRDGRRERDAGEGQTRQTTAEFLWATMGRQYFPLLDITRGDDPRHWQEIGMADSLSSARMGMESFARELSGKRRRLGVRVDQGLRELEPGRGPEKVWLVRFDSDPLKHLTGSDRQGS